MLNTRKTLLAAIAFGWATLALAADPAPPTKDAREKMAQAHEKMAACLRSERELADCRREMMQSCKATMGEQGCSMGMGMGMMGHGNRQGPNNPPSTKSP